jgi:HAD superfamily hydrolase (TIGR01509 family)
MIKGLLLDFNGVVINDEPIQMRAYLEVLTEHRIDLTEEDYYASLGMDDRTFVRAAYERGGNKVEDKKVDEIVAAKSAKWRSFVEKELPLFEGIDGFIEKCSHHFSLGLVSMSRLSEIDFVLDKTGLGKFFSIIVSAEDVEKCKPDPECFRIGFKRLDAARMLLGHLPMTHGECLVIEDSPPGVAGARAADLPALGVSNTVDADALRAAGAGAVAKDLRDWMPESIQLVFT